MSRSLRHDGWTLRKLRHNDDSDLYAIDGDIMDLDGLWNGFTDNHPHSGGLEMGPTLSDANAVIECSPSFYDTSSFRTMREHCTVRGRDDLLELVQEHLASDKIREVVEHVSGRRSHRLRVRWGDDGDELDVGRHLLGEDDVAWRRMDHHETERPSRIVVLDINISASGSVTRDQYTWNGVQAAVIVDALEAEGYRVEVYGSDVTRLHMDAGFCCTRILLKRANEPLRLDLLASQVGSPALMRTAGFRAMHMLPPEVDITGYGRAVADGTLERGINYAAAPGGSKPDHILPTALSSKKALRGIREVMAAYAPPADDAA